MSNVKSWKEISNDVAIRTDYYQPKITEDGQATGLLEFVKQRTFKELREQFEEALKAMYVEAWEHDAFGGAENISFYEFRQNVSLELPKGSLKVIVCDGNCEGTRIELIMHDSDNNFTPILSAKYLSDRDIIWEIGKNIDEACRNGQFGY